MYRPGQCFNDGAYQTEWKTPRIEISKCQTIFLLIHVAQVREREKRRKKSCNSPLSGEKIPIVFISVKPYYVIILSLD